MRQPDFDAVLIGRNEGTRLVAALLAAQKLARRVVYVDSGSSDGSAKAARALGVEVVELDPARAFTAARGRNEGFAALGTERADFVQFLDGDCLVIPDWPSRALDFLQQNAEAGLVHGHIFEEHPNASIFNWMTDWEWKKPEGPDAKGIGCFMLRAEVFEATGGLRDTMIAAEDDEFFARIRSAGWQTWCIAQPMCRHDIALRKFRPWFKRSIRAGHSFAELDALHPGLAVRPVLRSVIWGGLLPALAICGLLVWPPLALLVLLGYLAQIVRNAFQMARLGLDARRAFLSSLLLMTSKFANIYGVMLYYWRRWRGGRADIIEYKRR
jgi:GT2 family glycosyltransferase